MSAPVSPVSAAWRIMTRSGRVAAVLAIVAAVVLVLSLWTTITAILGPSPRPPVVPAAQQHAEQQKKAFDGYLAQFGGRSLFVLPVPPRVPDPEPVVSNSPDRPSPPPSSYGGPSIVAMLSDLVWFSGGRRLKVGEKSDDIEVIALHPPWEAKLKWKDVEFTVGLFERNKLVKPPDGKPAGAISPEAQAAPDPPPRPQPQEASPQTNPNPNPPADPVPPRPTDDAGNSPPAPDPVPPDDTTPPPDAPEEPR